MALEPIFNEPHPDSSDDYILKIDNPYNTSTWTHPDLAIEIILRDSKGSNIKDETQASGIFNLGPLKNGDYNLQMCIVSSKIPPPNDKSKTISHNFTISGSPHGPAPKTPATELKVSFHNPGPVPQGESRKILSKISGGTPLYYLTWTGSGVTGDDFLGEVDYKFDIVPKETIKLKVVDSDGVKKEYIESVDVIPKTPDKPLSVTFHNPGPVTKGSTIAIDAVVTGGTPPYTFNWIGPGITSPNDIKTINYEFNNDPNEIIRLEIEDKNGDKADHVENVAVTTDSSSSDTSSGTVTAEGGAGGAGGSAEGGSAEGGSAEVGDVSATVGDISVNPEITVNPEFTLNFNGIELTEGIFEKMGFSISSDELLNERLNNIQEIIAAERKDMQKLILLLTNKINKDKLEEAQVDKIYNTLKTQVLQLLNGIIVELKNFAKQNEDELTDYNKLITSLREIVLNVNILNENIQIEKIMPADWDEKLFEKYNKKALFKKYESAVNGLNKEIKMHNKRIVEAKNLIAKLTPENLANLENHQTIIPGLITETHNIVEQLENSIAELGGDLSADELESEFTKILGLLSGDLTLIKAEKNKIDALKSEFEKLHNELINTKHKLKEKGKGKWKSHGLKDWFGLHEDNLEDSANAVQEKEDELRAILKTPKPVEPFKLTPTAQTEWGLFSKQADLLERNYIATFEIPTATGAKVNSRQELIINLSGRNIIKKGDFDLKRYNNAILKLTEKSTWSSSEDMLNYIESKANELRYAREQTVSIINVLSTEGRRDQIISSEQAEALTAILVEIGTALTKLYDFASKANIYNQ